MSNGKDKEESTRTCNCRDKTSCPLKEKYFQEEVLYKAAQPKSLEQDAYQRVYKLRSTVFVHIMGDKK